MKGGWFIGNFHPTAWKSKDFEVCYRLHLAGEKWEKHYHTKITEINLLISGKMMIQDQQIGVGDIFILHPYEIADPIFLEDCQIVCIKTPAVPDDKIIIIDN